MAVHTSNQAAPARKFVAVVPSDATFLPAGCRGIYVGVTGDVSLNDEDNVNTVFTAVPVGFMPCGARRVNSTGTTATNMVALY